MHIPSHERAAEQLERQRDECRWCRHAAEVACPHIAQPGIVAFGG
ncbi:MAG: hypothetical protein WBH47_13000 [Streptosporangiaceae bacterium]